MPQSPTPPAREEPADEGHRDRRREQDVEQLHPQERSALRVRAKTAIATTEIAKYR